MISLGYCFVGFLYLKENQRHPRKHRLDTEWYLLFLLVGDEALTAYDLAHSSIVSKMHTLVVVHVSLLFDAPPQKRNIYIASLIWAEAGCALAKNKRKQTDISSGDSPPNTGIPPNVDAC